jgi:hypothetical protein
MALTPLFRGQLRTYSDSSIVLSDLTRGHHFVRCCRFLVYLPPYSPCTQRARLRANLLQSAVWYLTQHPREAAYWSQLRSQWGCSQTMPSEPVFPTNFLAHLINVDAPLRWRSNGAMADATWTQLQPNRRGSLARQQTVGAMVDTILNDSALPQTHRRVHLGLASSDSPPPVRDLK